MPAPTTSSQYAAAQSEMIIVWWRDWVRFLDAHATLNAVQQERMTGRATTAADAFDQDHAATSVDARERQAAASLDRIPAARRMVFEAELQERVAAHQAAGAGADEPITAITARALGDLADRAHGRITTGEDAGKAGVPCEGRVWFTFPPEQLHAMPPEEAWAIAGPRRSELPPWRLIAAIIVIVAIWGGGALYYLWPQLFPPETASAAGPAPALLVNGSPAAQWPVRAVAAGSATLPVAPLDGDTWDATPDGMAGWRRAAAWPLALCLPEAAAQALPDAITLLGAGDGLDRTFTLSADAAPRRPDLRLVSCARGSWLADGTLQASAPQVQFAPGALHPIPQLGDLTLTDVRVTTAAQRPAIAAGRAQVVITLAAPADVDWPAWLPALRFADGSAARTATVDTADGLTALTYDVPASALHVGDALWQITAPSDDGLGATYRWALSLTPP